MKGKIDIAFKPVKDYTNNNGYVFIYRPNHPNANKSGYINRSRYILSKRIGRKLYPHEQSHHINGIKNDDRPENLRLVTITKHRNIHKRKVKK